MSGNPWFDDRVSEHKIMIDEKPEWLPKLYHEVTALGGFKEVVANQEWPIVHRNVPWPDDFSAMNPNEARKYYEKFLYHFERTNFEVSLFRHGDP
jgi:hypothetical protein